MKRILHIFRKDAIRLWPQVLVFLTLLAANAWEDRKFAHEVPNGPSPLQLLAALLPIACTVLLIALIQQERLIGDRQYWVTRPIPTRELMGAKILFILVFVNLPVSLSQAAIVAADGLPVFQHWTDFLWMQLFFTAVQILPVTALAAVTRNMTQAILAILGTLAVVAGAAFPWADLLSAYLPNDISLLWIEVSFAAAALAVGSMAVLLLQYLRRGAMLSRTLLAGTLIFASLALLLPHSVKWAIQMAFSPEHVDANDFRLSPGGTMDRPPEREESAPNDTPVSLEFSLRIDRPLGVSISAENFQATVQEPSGHSSTPSWKLESTHSYEGNTSLRVNVDREFYLRVKDTPVHFYGTFDFTILADGQAIPFPGRRPVYIPGVGVCGGPPEGSSLVSCDATLPRARLAPVVDGEAAWDDSSGAVLAPFPYSPGYSPLTSAVVLLPGRFRSHPGEVSLFLQRPIAYLQRRFDFGSIILANYEVAPSNAYFYK